MHDIRFIRENPAAFDKGLLSRNVEALSASLEPKSIVLPGDYTPPS